jgi:hypothetical protein
VLNDLGIYTLGDNPNDTCSSSDVETAANSSSGSSGDDGQASPEWIMVRLLLVRWDAPWLLCASGRNWRSWRSLCGGCGGGRIDYMFIQ